MKEALRLFKSTINNWFSTKEITAFAHSIYEFKLAYYEAINRIKIIITTRWNNSERKMTILNEAEEWRSKIRDVNLDVFIDFFKWFNDILEEEKSENEDPHK